MAQRAVSWRSASNIWSMKNDQYDINTRENVNAYSRYIGATQRNFGLEVQQFMKNNETLFRSNVSKTPVNEGNRSSSFGRSMRLSQLYAEGAMKANLRRADIQQTEKLGEGYRKLLTAQSQEMGKRGFGPVPTVQPAKPVGPSFLDQAVAVASTALSFVSSVQSIGAAAGATGACFGNPAVGAGAGAGAAGGAGAARNSLAMNMTPSYNSTQLYTGAYLSGAYG